MIIRAQGEDSPLRKAIGRDLKGKISPVVYIAGCVAALLGGGGTGLDRPGMWIAVACYVGVAALWVIPDRRIETAIAVLAEQGDHGEPDGDLAGERLRLERNANKLGGDLGALLGDARAGRRRNR